MKPIPLMVPSGSLVSALDRASVVVVVDGSLVVVVSVDGTEVVTGAVVVVVAAVAAVVVTAVAAVVVGAVFVVVVTSPPQPASARASPIMTRRATMATAVMFGAIGVRTGVMLVLPP
jgi:hypothetical protein